MTSAVDALIAAALLSDKAELRTLAVAAQAEQNRGPGAIPKLSHKDLMAKFIVFEGIFARHYTEGFIGEGEPLAITEPTIDTTEAIAQNLMDYSGCKIGTARAFARKQIAKLKLLLEEELLAKGVRINMQDAPPKKKIATLKATKEKLINNS